MFIRAATLAAGLAIVASVALLTPAGAGAACPAGKYCTDSTGKYTLVVPPLSGPIYGSYADCIWQVHVNFGDGTAADYVFEGDKGLSGSHTFPSYGEYTVSATLSNGYHRNSPTQEACPSPTQYAFVLYRDPALVAEEEAKEKEAKEQKEKEEKEKGQPPKEEPAEEEPAKKPGGSGGSNGSGGAGEEERENGESHPIHVWRNCSHNVYAHRVACRRAQKVIEAAQEKLAERKAARVAGFQCHLTDGLRPISCRRGKGRVLGPLG